MINLASNTLQPSEAIPQRLPITPEAKALFEQQGFISFDRITSPSDVAFIRGILEELFARRAGFDEGAFYDLAGTGDEDGNFKVPQIIDPRSYAPALMNSEFVRNALEVARALLGPEAKFMGDHALNKPARVGGQTPWHQDDAFLPPSRERAEISIWMPLQPVDLVNGCMGFIPGSHLGEVLPHMSMNGNSKIHGIECCEGFSPDDAVYCPLPAGGCTIHTSRTLHGGPPNLSTQARLAYVLIFRIPSIATRISEDWPWLAGKVTPQMKRRRAWMRHGGLFIHSWRRLKQIKEFGYREAILRIRSKIRVL